MKMERPSPPLSEGVKDTISEGVKEVVKDAEGAVDGSCWR